MNIHEYQAKALLRSYGIPVSDGRVVLKAEEAKAKAAHAAKVDGYKLCKSMDAVAAHYVKTAGAKASKPSSAACARSI